MTDNIRIQEEIETFRAKRRRVVRKENLNPFDHMHLFPRNNRILMMNFKQTVIMSKLPRRKFTFH